MAHLIRSHKYHLKSNANANKVNLIGYPDWSFNSCHQCQSVLTSRPLKVLVFVRIGWASKRSCLYRPSCGRGWGRLSGEKRRLSTGCPVAIDDNLEWNTNTNANTNPSLPDVQLLLNIQCTYLHPIPIFAISYSSVSDVIWLLTKTPIFFNYDSL